MKKLLLTLGSIGAVVAPVASVVACGSDDNAFKMTVDLSKFADNPLGATDEMLKQVGELTDKVQSGLTSIEIDATNMAGEHKVFKFGKDNMGGMAEYTEFLKKGM